jgi:WD40 repeat protein
VEKSWPQQVQQLRGHNQDIGCVAFSLDESKIVSESDDWTIRVWDASTGIEMLPPLQGRHGRVESITFSSDGSKIISGSSDSTV